mgnify:CR=1 FL=1
MKTANPREAESEFLLAVVLAVFSWVLIVSAHAASPMVRVEPRESDELFANPGMGWQTFHRFADNDPNLAGLPSASAYFRFLVIRGVEHDAKPKVGATTTVSIQWENAGVAPPYRDYRLAIRLRPGDSKTGPSDHMTDTSIRGWLPGRHRTDSTLQLPAELAPDRYEVAVGVVDPRDRQPAVRLANAGRDAEGWYRISELEIVP